VSRPPLLCFSAAVCLFAAPEAIIPTFTPEMSRRFSKIIARAAAKLLAFDVIDHV